jgi:ubiquinone/menaquinone biosynthesis C-methylase UbiE
MAMNPSVGPTACLYSNEVCRVLNGKGKVIAMDIDADKLKLVKDTASKGGFEVETQIADFDKNLILPNYCADLLLVANTLFQLENKNNFLNECYRILAPTGQLVIIDWKAHSALGPSDDRLINREELEKELSEIGFRYFKELPAGEYHFALIYNR